MAQAFGGTDVLSRLADRSDGTNNALFVIEKVVAAEIERTKFAQRPVDFTLTQDPAHVGLLSSESVARIERCIACSQRESLVRTLERSRAGLNFNAPTPWPAEFGRVGILVH